MDDVGEISHFCSKFSNAPSEADSAIEGALLNTVTRFCFWLFTVMQLEIAQGPYSLAIFSQDTV